MTRRWTSFLLLIAFVAWASGAAHLAHARLDHARPVLAGGQSCPACQCAADGVIARLRIAVTAAKSQRPVPLPAPTRPVTNCTVCQLLATMSTEPVMLPAAAPA